VVPVQQQSFLYLEQLQQYGELKIENMVNWTILYTNVIIFTVQRYASAAYRHHVYVCLSHSDIVSERLNVGSC